MRVCNVAVHVSENGKVDQNEKGSEKTTRREREKRKKAIIHEGKPVKSASGNKSWKAVFPMI